MKKILFTAAFSIQLAMAPFAQPGSADETLAYSNKKTIGKNNVNLSAVRDLSNRFGNVENAKWSTNKDFLRARFTRSNIMYMVDYDHNGRWVSTIRVYDENNLRSDIRRIVKSNYIDFEIVKVIELEIGKSQIHFVKLESQTSLLTLHIMNGEIAEIENYAKG